MTNGPDRIPSTSGYGNTNTDIYTNEVRPQYPSTTFTSTPMYVGDAKPEYPYPPQYPGNYNNYQDTYPMYSFPMLYNGDAQYPGMNSFSTNGYAANVPSIGIPQTNYYGNSMTTTTTTATATAMNGGRPSLMPHGTDTMTSSTPYMGNGWSNADEINRRKPYGDKTTPSMPNSNGYGGGMGTTRYPEGNYDNNNNESRPRSTIPYIRTYFNPDDYIANEKRE